MSQQLPRLAPDPPRHQFNGWRADPRQPSVDPGCTIQRRCRARSAAPCLLATSVPPEPPR